MVEPLEPLVDPLHGEPCVAIEYRAWPPSTTVGLNGGTMYNTRAFQVSEVQMVSFILLQRHERILVRVFEGTDVAAVHRELLDQYGVGLRAEVDVIVPGTRVRVAGTIESSQPHQGSPMRMDPFRATLRAERVRRI